MATTLGVAILVSLIGSAPMRGPDSPRAWMTDPDACSLLTEAQASAAIEVKVGPGKHAVASSTKQCMWSDDPAGHVDHRRLILSLTTPAAFDFGKQNASLKPEAVTGVGDDAYYEYFGADAPALVVKKGSSVITVRILNGLKLKVLGKDVIKAKELEVAKAAVTKL